jgi:hypothetical protein
LRVSDDSEKCRKDGNERCGTGSDNRTLFHGKLPVFLWHKNGETSTAEHAEIAEIP